MFLARLFVNLSGLPVCLDTPDKSSSSVPLSVKDAWDIHWDELGVVPEDVV